MPNQCQPQGLLKTALNPIAHANGKFIVDFDLPEADGTALASQLDIILEDGAARESIDVVFNPALLRTRFDSVSLSIDSNADVAVNVYTLTKPDHLDDYTQADKTTLTVTANKVTTLTITKEANVILFNTGETVHRLALNPAPEDGSTTSTPA